MSTYPRMVATCTQVLPAYMSAAGNRQCMYAPSLISSAATSRQPAATHHCRGVRIARLYRAAASPPPGPGGASGDGGPAASAASGLWLTCTPLPSFRRRTSSPPPPAAASGSCLCALAPNARRSTVIEYSPSRAARCSGVTPPSKAASTSAPWCRSVSTAAFRRDSTA